MKILIFGTGKIYNILKNSIRNNVDIIGLVDNDQIKQGIILDGKIVYSPQDALTLEFDYIALFSRSDSAMKAQLMDLGIEYERILTYDRLYRVLECIPASMQGGLMSIPNRKILIFSHAFTFSGAQNVLLKAIEILLNHGYGIVCVSNVDGELHQRLVEKGVTTILCQDFSCSLLQQAVKWADMLLINTLWLQYLVEEYIDSGKKIIWWLHESGSYSHYNPIGIDYLFMKNNLQIYAVSQVVVDYIARLYDVQDHIHLLPFGFPEYLIHRQEQKIDLIFLQVGPIVKIKGQDILSMAVEGLPDSVKKQVRFLIVGDETAIPEMTDCLRRNKCVELIGKVDNLEMPSYYAKTDVVICCSREESMSVAVMEGFMNGIPAIVSDVTGITEYMEDGREGLIFQSENVEELQQKIMYMVDHRDRIVEMGRNARENYLKNFTMEQFEKNLLRVFEV